MLFIEPTLRAILLTCALINVGWAFPGTRKFAKGYYDPPNIYMSFAFFSNVSFLAFQIRYFLGVYDLIWTILLLVVSIVAVVLAAIGQFSGANRKIAQFHSLYGALPEAFAIAELARHDPGAANRMAQECWALITTKIHSEIDRA